MPHERDLAYWLRRLRWIEEHRTEQVEQALRREYERVLKELRAYVGETILRYGVDGKLDFGELNRHGEYRRFLEEVRRQISGLSDIETRMITQVVEEMAKISYSGVLDAARKGGGTLRALADSVRMVEPGTLARAAQNPVRGLTLNSRLRSQRRDIIYEIDKIVTNGIMNGDRYETMAMRIEEQLLGRDPLRKPEGAYAKALRIARTETHRVVQGGEFDAWVEMDEALKAAGGAQRVFKTWRTAKDERVRPQHRYKTKKGWHTSISGKADHQKMEGVRLRLDEQFDLGNGVKTLMPGNSGSAENDINCRCRLSYETGYDVGDLPVAQAQENGTMETTGEVMELKAFTPAGSGATDTIDEAVKSKEFTPAASIEEAKEYARQVLGIEGQYDKFNLEIANAVNREITDAYRMFGNLHEQHRLLRVQKDPRRGTNSPAAYVRDQGALLLKNPGSKSAYKMMVKEAKLTGEAGYWSTSEETHAVRHELGHAIREAHIDATKQAEIESFRQGLLQEIATGGVWSETDLDGIARAKDAFSYYALYNDREMVAEAVAEYMAGSPRYVAKQIVDIVMRGAWPE